MIRHHPRALVVRSTDLTATDRLPVWAEESRGMGRRTYDGWAACLPNLVESPAADGRAAGRTSGDSDPDRRAPDTDEDADEDADDLGRSSHGGPARPRAEVRPEPAGGDGVQPQATSR